MPTTFHQELASLKMKLLEMSSLVEEVLRDTWTAFSKRDVYLAHCVHDKDDEIDKMENEIDHQCLKLLALQQPMAIDLRFITVAMRININLERAGDQAVNIAERVILMAEEPFIIRPLGINRMASQAESMLREALNAFVDQDTGLAGSVRERDDVVDKLYLKVVCDILEHMMNDPSTITQGVHLLIIALNLERIADLATNIAEDVIFMVEGRVIRHIGEQGREGGKQA
ncbi:MAG: phosphate signaling complex protein PhoU [Deltaproteobacteria bacterium]|nr:phosphate signaling complex protein PhoU [Deltaproteobacteria bacterium]